MEAGAKVSGSRFAYLRGDVVLLEMALFRWALELLGEDGFEPVLPPVLVREAGAVRDGLPARHRAADLRARRRRPLPRRHQRGRARVPARGRGDRAAAALRGHLAVLPPRGRRRGPRHARHPARPPVRQGRDVLVRRAGRRRRPSTSGCWRSRSEILQALDIPYRVVNIAVDDLGASAAKKYDCEAWMPGQGALPRGHVDLQHDRLPGPPARHPPARAAASAATLNGTAVTWRHMIALLENHGGAIPEVLQEWGAPARVGAHRMS